MRVITKEVQGGANCDSSLFRAEFEIADDDYQERYASTFFFQLVAGALDSKNNANLKDGLGYAHEYLTHKVF
jgi:hypothetical protein